MSLVNKNVADFVAKKINRLDVPLSRLRATAIADHVPIIGDQVAAFLRFQLAQIAPRQILEIGTAVGYSGALMLTYSTAHLTTLELDAGVRQRALQNFDDLGLTPRVTSLLGDASQLLAELPSRHYDLIFIDAGKGHYLDYFQKGLALLKPGGVIIADNVLLRGFLAGEPHPRRQRTANQRMNEFIDYVCQHPAFDSALLTIGDGVLICKERVVNE